MASFSLLLTGSSRVGDDVTIVTTSTSTTTTTAPTSTIPRNNDNNSNPLNDDDDDDTKNNCSITIGGMTKKYLHKQEHDNDTNININNNHTLQQQQQQQQQQFNLRHEAASLIHLTLPSVLVQLCLYFVFPQAASVVGRQFGSEALAGFSLGSLVGNLTCLSIMVGALTAADTLLPRAYGVGKYNAMGVLLVQSLIVCGILLIPPLILLSNNTAMSHILSAYLGQDPLASNLAADWIQIYLLGVPANLTFRLFQRFLVAQRRPWPPVICATIPCFVVQPFVLSIVCQPHNYGFLGSAWAIVVTQWSVMILLGLQTYVWPVHHPSSWPTLDSWKRAWKPKSLRKFASLSLGGVLSLSEWWFWETMCFVAGSFGIEALCAHTIAYNMIPLLYMIPLGFSIGLTVRMGHTLALGRVDIAMRIVAWCMGTIVVLGVIVAMSLYLFRDGIIQLFINPTDNPLVFEQTREIWPMVSIYIFVLYVFGINGAILKGLGMQWRLAWIIVMCLWCGLLPCVVYLSIIRGGGLVSQWKLLPTFYVVMQVCLVLSYMTADWHRIGQTTMSRLVESSSRSLADVKAVVADDGDPKNPDFLEDDYEDDNRDADEGDGTTSFRGGNWAANETTPLVSTRTS